MLVCYLWLRGACQWIHRQSANDTYLRWRYANLHNSLYVINNVGHCGCSIDLHYWSCTRNKARGQKTYPYVSSAQPRSRKVRPIAPLNDRPTNARGRQKTMWRCPTRLLKWQSVKTKDVSLPLRHLKRQKSNVSWGEICESCQNIELAGRSAVCKRNSQ